MADLDRFVAHHTAKLIQHTQQLEVLRQKEGDLVQKLLQRTKAVSNPRGTERKRKGKTEQPGPGKRAKGRAASPPPVQEAQQPAAAGASPLPPTVADNLLEDPAAFNMWLHTLNTDANVPQPPAEQSAQPEAAAQTRGPLETLSTSAQTEEYFDAVMRLMQS